MDFLWCKVWFVVDFFNGCFAVVFGDKWVFGVVGLVAVFYCRDFLDCVDE